MNRTQVVQQMAKALWSFVWMGGPPSRQVPAAAGKAADELARLYEAANGDTLTAIAHRARTYETGESPGEVLCLYAVFDPQEAPPEIRVPSFEITLDGDSLSWEGDASHANPCCRHNGPAVEVLVVEDDPDIKKMYPRVIRKALPGAEVHVVDNYTAAIGYLESHDIALVVSDVDILGPRSGVDVFRWVEENRPNLVDRYIFVTGGNPHVKDIHYRYMEKPFTPGDLTDEIRSAMGVAAPAPRTKAPTPAPRTRKTSAPPATRAHTVTGTVMKAAAPGLGANEQAVLSTFDRLDRGQNYVLLYDMRLELPIGRDAFNEAVNNLRRAKILSLDSDDGRHVRLTSDERAAGIQEAGSNLVYAQRREAAPHLAGYQGREMTVRHAAPAAAPPRATTHAGSPVDAAYVAKIVNQQLPKVEALPSPVRGELGRFGDKVFISALWRDLQSDPRMGGMTYDQFRKALLDANRMGLLTLARGDVIGAMDPNEVRDSEINDRGATFHFVLHPGWRRNPARGGRRLTSDEVRHLTKIRRVVDNILSDKGAKRRTDQIDRALASGVMDDDVAELIEMYDEAFVDDQLDSLQGR